MKPASEPRKESKHQYAVTSGHAWTTGLAQVLLDEYSPFLDQGYELDSLGNHFLGGQGFRAEDERPVRMEKPS